MVVGGSEEVWNHSFRGKHGFASAKMGGGCFWWMVDGVQSMHVVVSNMDCCPVRFKDRRFLVLPIVGSKG